MRACGSCAGSVALLWGQLRLCTVSYQHGICLPAHPPALPSPVLPSSQEVHSKRVHAQQAEPGGSSLVQPADGTAALRAQGRHTPQHVSTPCACAQASLVKPLMGAWDQSIPGAADRAGLLLCLTCGGPQRGRSGRARSGGHRTGWERQRPPPQTQTCGGQAGRGPQRGRVAGRPALAGCLPGAAVAVTRPLCALLLTC